MKIPGYYTSSPFPLSHGHIKEHGQQAERSQRNSTSSTIAPSTTTRHMGKEPGGEIIPSRPARASANPLSILLENKVYRELMRGPQTVGAFAPAAESQRAADKAEGIGLLQGARDFADLISRGIASVEVEEKSSGSAPTLEDISFVLGQMEELGVEGREQLLKHFGSEALRSARTLLTETSAGTSGTVSASVVRTGAAKAGMTTTGGVAGSGAATVGGVASGTSSTLPGSPLTGVGGRILGLAGAIYSGYQLIANWGKTDITTGALNGTAAGAYIGSAFPGLGTVVGGVIGGLLGAASGVFRSSGKHEDQKVRDHLRNGLQNLGIADKEFKIQLADGTFYDIGKDGGFTLRNLDGSSRRVYDTDSSNPLTSQAIGLINPLASLLAGENPKATSDLAGMLTNAVMSSAENLEDVRKNVLKIVSNLGLTEERFNAAFAKYAENKNLSGEDYARFMNGIHTIFNPQALEAQAPELFSRLRKVETETAVRPKLREIKANGEERVLFQSTQGGALVAEPATSMS